MDTRSHSFREDRVQEHTDAAVNAKIDDETVGSIEWHGTAEKPAMEARLRELDREWDIERTLEANAASFSLLGLALGAFLNRRWLLLPTVVGGFLLLHAVQEWCPPVPVFRRLGIRTRKEIERERYALKFLRGDFGAASDPKALSPSAILKMVDE